MYVPRAFLAIISALALIVSLVALGGPAAATYSGSVTDVLDNSIEQTACHGDFYYFNPIYGWTRSCIGAHDIKNNYVSPNVYIRGYVWQTAQIVAAQPTTVYFDQTCNANNAGIEYNNAWQISVSAGTIGVAFHHMSNYHYAINSVVNNGTHIGEQANWGRTVYFCNGAVLSTGPHIHTEGAEVGTNFSDSWKFDGTPPNYPFISYTQP